MAIKSGFFNSVNGDRKYNADDISDFYLSFLSSGVMVETGNELQVVADGGFNIIVIGGWAYINAKYIHNTTDYSLTLSQPSQNTRIDRIVLRLDTSLSGRQISIAVKQGEQSESPSAPVLTREGDIWELSLARITIRANADEIKQSDITDERSVSSLCGFTRIKSGLIEEGLKYGLKEIFSTYIKNAIDCLYPHDYSPTKIELTVGEDLYSNSGDNWFMYDISDDVFDPETDGLFVWLNDTELIAKSLYRLDRTYKPGEDVTTWWTHKMKLDLQDGDKMEFLIYKNSKLSSSSTGTIGQLSAYTSAVTQSTIGRSKKIIDLLDGYDITAINSNNGLTKGFEVDIYDTDVLSADKITIYATYCGEFDDDTPTDIACWAESWSTGTNNTKDIINYISNRPLPLEFEIGDGASGLTIECLGLNFDFAAEKLTEFYIELE